MVVVRGGDLVQIRPTLRIRMWSVAYVTLLLPTKEIRSSRRASPVAWTPTYFCLSESNLLPVVFWSMVVLQQLSRQK
jgi:hypothetical protein